MEYRTNRRTGDKISVIGFGTSAIPQTEEKQFIKTLNLAYENGINYYDLATSDASCFPVFGKAFEGVRKNVMYQLHFGADYTKGSYGWTTDAETIKRSVDWQLRQLKTDYIDYAFIHCMDEASDWKKYKDGGTLGYIGRLKEQGVFRHIGMSSHSPSMVQKVLDGMALDMVMFSINPAYDFERGDEYGIGSCAERQKLYRRCEAAGVGISVMKAFSGGQLLSEKTSPFGKALTEYQCIRYALDKPGVLTVLPGVRGESDLRRILGYLSAGEQEKDYSVIASFTPKEADGKCVYCNHCQPCPAGIDIGMANKYYDLARAGDVLAADHYKKLEKNASDCIACGHCNRRCPFHVDQMSRIKEIAAYFRERQ